MRKYILFLLVLVLATVLLGMSPPLDGKKSSQQEQGLIQRVATDNSWPRWSGPKSLGPSSKIPDRWSIQLTYFYAPSYAYLIEINSAGEWQDKSPRIEQRSKGHLTKTELRMVKEALADIDWNKPPKLCTGDYTAYHLKPKEYLEPAGFLGYKIDYWGDQTKPTPWYEGRRIMVDLKAPAAPEALELIGKLKPLLEKYIPRIEENDGIYYSN